MASKQLGLKKEDGMDQELFLQVEDEAHVQQQSASYLDEQKGLREKDMDTHQKMGVQEGGQSDLQLERQAAKVLQPSDELDSLEQERLKTRRKRLERNIQTIQDASARQVDKMEALRAQFRAVTANSPGHVNVQAYRNAQEAVMNQANSATSLFSMAINDALMNGGKAEGYEEDMVGETASLLGPKRGRQKTIVINGASVTLDEDVAEAILHQRSPIVSKRKKVLTDGRGIPGAAVQEVDAAASKIVKSVDAQMDAAYEKVSDVQAEQTVQREVPAKMLAMYAAYETYEKSRFAALERRIQADRCQMNQALIVPEEGVQYAFDQPVPQKQQERELPAVAWAVVYEPMEYLPDGRRLPHMDYSSGNGYQYML